MVNIQDILDFKLLHDEIDNGYVRARSHPLYPTLLILNYSEKTQFEKHWNDVTRMCRGLIYDQYSEEVLARPFHKIHNFDEAEAPKIEWDQVVYHWSDKVDGSLGIVYITPDNEVAIATRGSFESEQAKHATALINTSPYANLLQDFRYRIEDGHTPLVEIIYPENRIVVDYGDEDDLVFLGTIEMASGFYLPGYTMEQIKPRRTFGDLMMDLSRPNSEGWVVWSSAYKAVKIKQADYIELHRIVTGLNRKSVWRALRDGYDVYIKMLEQLPDELYAWAKGVGSELAHAYGAEAMKIDQHYIAVLENLEDHNIVSTDRKAFALAVKLLVPQKYQGYMFSLADSKDISDKIWRSLEPEGGER